MDLTLGPGHGARDTGKEAPCQCIPEGHSSEHVCHPVRGGIGMERLPATIAPVALADLSSGAGGLEQRVAVLESENAQMTADVAHIRNSGGQADRLAAVLRRDVARSQEVRALHLPKPWPWAACMLCPGMCMPGLS